MIPSQLLSLANHVWQSTLFAAAAGLLALALRRNRAEIRYSLWLAASVKFLIPFSVLVTMGVHFAPHTIPDIMPAAARSTIPLVINEVSQPFAVIVPLAAMPPAQPSFQRLIPLLLGVLWAIGFVIVSASWWRRWRQIRTASRAATPLRLLTGIEVMSSLEFIEPGVFGVWRPILLLPDGLTDHLTPGEMDAVLAHELCHIRRRDNLAAAVHMAVEALFWFHPLVWWLGARLMEERERACDEEVLRMGTEPAEYAEGILKICELYAASPLQCAAGVTGGNLRKRIEEIMTNCTKPQLSAGRKLLLATGAMLAVAVPVIVGIEGVQLRAQAPAISREAGGIAGNWQGTLQAGPQNVRLVFKIALENDKLQATLYTVDQPSPPIATTITRDGSTVKLTIPAMNAKYEGKLSGDGNSIAGTWNWGAPQALNLTRATPETAWAIPEPPPPPVRMAPNANPAFEVATIKPSDPAKPGQIVALRGVEVITTNTTLHDLINLAYWLHPKQLTGGPAWTESARFDLTGKPDAPGQPNVDQMKIMIQKLLADRFQLKFHFEKRDLSAYAIRIAKTGAKITRSLDDPKGIPGWFFGRNASGMTMTFRNAPLSQVAALLQNSMDKPVVDQSGLSERYDFTLTFTPDAAQATRLGGPPPPAADNPDAAPDLFAAFQQQLGLKLEPTRAPVDVMVIDKVEKPSEN